jgi:hypothetical protein
VQIDEEIEVLFQARASSLEDGHRRLLNAQRSSKDAEDVGIQQTSLMQQFEKLKLDWGSSTGARLPGMIYSFTPPLVPGSDSNSDTDLEISWYVV